MRVPEIVGYRLREARDELDWSQAEFAEHLEAFTGRRWFPQTVSAAEKGARDFTAEEIYSIASVLRRPVQFFFRPPAGIHTVELPGQTLDVVEADKSPVDRLRTVHQELGDVMVRLELEGTAAAASGAEATPSLKTEEEGQ